MGTLRFGMMCRILILGHMYDIYRPVQDNVTNSFC
jgi:hypothetical protein